MSDAVGGWDWALLAICERSALGPVAIRCAIAEEYSRSAIDGLVPWLSALLTTPSRRAA